MPGTASEAGVTTGRTLLRSYEPALNRFSQKDILRGDMAQPLSLNRYLYVRNDPLNMIDPTGMWAYSGYMNEKKAEVEATAKSKAKSAANASGKAKSSALDDWEKYCKDNYSFLPDDVKAAYDKAVKKGGSGNSKSRYDALLEACVAVALAQTNAQGTPTTVSPPNTSNPDALAGAALSGLTWPGEIHRAVQLDASKVNQGAIAIEISVITNGKIGRIDLMNSMTGEIWEIKPDKQHYIEKALKQLAVYQGGEMRDDYSNLSGKLIPGTSLIGNQFEYIGGKGAGDNYIVRYHQAEPGVVLYSYTKQQERQEQEQEQRASASLPVPLMVPNPNPKEVNKTPGLVGQLALVLTGIALTLVNGVGMQPKTVTVGPLLPFDSYEYNDGII